MEFVLNRNKVHVSRLGHSIEFKKGEKTHVPPELWPEVQAIGAVPAEELPEEKVADTPEPADPIARKKVIFETFEKLVLAKKRDDFSGTGMPHTKAIAQVAGFTIDSKERDALWNEFQQAKGK